MTEAGAYSPRVLEFFRSPRHAGAPSGEPGISVAVSEGGAGARIRLAGVSDGERWTRLCWQVFGCPHTMAAAEAACRRFEGAAHAAPREFAFVELVEELAIPVEKTGRVLLLEDAFRALEAARCTALESDE